MAKKTTTRSRKKTTKKTVRRAKTTASSRKAPARKTTRKTTRKAPARRAGTATKSTGTKITGARGKPRTKSEVQALIAEHVGISKKEVAQVFDTMSTMIAADLKKGSVGTFNVPGMMKVTVQRKPATKARKGINPFTKEPTVFKAKPARNVVKVRPLKALKDMVA
ncbi:MAG: HU family DNA-binding protein [Phycisphaera sp.]|nr:MAG: HU family DNA-binding protein [Phycisphaera sp.]